MNPLYTQCPHCDFPVVLSGVEKTVARRCRQCREQFTPTAPASRRHSPFSSSDEGSLDKYGRLRSKVRQRKRLGI